MVLKEDENDDYFPRGGVGVKRIVKKRNFPFGRQDVDIPKKKKLGRRERKKLSAAAFELENDAVDCSVQFERVEPLVYNALSEGTLVLCSVREIFNNYVDICMPGRLSARLYVENVSEPYKKASQNKEDPIEVAPLKNIFHVGQHLTCSVLSVTNAGHYLVRVSSDPKQVNLHMAFDNVSDGSLIQMAVQSCEDHGYMMYSGIDGLISFLPKENVISYVSSVRNFQQLEIGQILWCLVTKSKLSETSNTVHVTIDSEMIQSNKLKNEISLEKLNPGVRTEITVNKIISQNLMVTIDNSDIKGYVEPSQLGSMWSKPSDYRVKSKHTATVLYKFPYPRVVALSLKANPATISKEEIAYGTIFERAEIMAILKRGIALKLEFNNDVYKGVMSVRRLGPGMDSEKLSEMFPIGNHVKCRVIGYDALEQVYSCTTEDKLLNEKYLSPKDLKVGEIVKITIENFKKGGLDVSAGEIKGFVPPHHISDVLFHNSTNKIKLRSQQKAKVLRIENNNVLFTLRPTLVKTSSLLSFDNLNVGDSYFGTVKKINPDSITVSFFGNLFTHINETNLIESPNKHTVGELVKCYVLKPSSYKKLPVFSLVKSVQHMDVTVGKKYDVRVKQMSKKGVKVLLFVKEKSFNGFIPVEHMSDYSELCELVMKKYPYYSVIEKAILFSVTDNTYTFTIRKSIENFFVKNPQVHGGFNQLKTNMILPASVSEIMSDKILVSVPIPGFNAKVPIEKEDLPQDPYEYDLNQGIVVKIRDLNTVHLKMTLTCKLLDKEKQVWSISHVENYLRAVESLQRVKMGTELECKVVEVHGSIVKVSTDLNIFGIVKSPTLQKQSFHKGQKIKALVLYHDVIKNLIYLLNPEDMLKMNNTLLTHLINRQVPGTIVCGNSVFLISLIHCNQGTQLALLPTKDDPNIAKYTSFNKIVPYSTCNITLRSSQTSEKIKYWIGFVDGLKLREESSEDEELEIIDIEKDSGSFAVNNKKKHLDKISESNMDSDKPIRSEIEGEGTIEIKKKKKKRENQSFNESEDCEGSFSPKKAVNSLTSSKNVETKILHKKNSEIKNEGNTNKQNKNHPSLEGVGGFNWDATPADLAKVISGIVEENGNDEVSEDSDDEKKPPKKMTPAEKRSAALEAEKKIREKEEELLQAEKNPETPEHFERLLLGHPNSSKFWIMYMAHHLQATEVDKARAVAKRAIKQINIRFEEERLNVWISSLNLEHFYGTPEQFKEVLSDALKYNDEYEVYRRVLDIYAQSKNSVELEKLTNLLVKKYKDKMDCWVKCMVALMKAEMYDKARNYLQRSLKVLPLKEHCTLISRFALIENQFGFPDQAQALFENLLTSYPKRVDLWSVYVDMLVKSDCADLARNVLERAISHKLPVRKMKALYQKWLKLEEACGTPESIQQVKDAANEYVNNLTHSLKNPL